MLDLMELINFSEDDWEWLHGAIQGCGIRYDNVGLPQGSCSPSVIWIQPQYTPHDGYVLLIQEGVTYTGKHQKFKSLFHDGGKKFDSFNDMKEYIKGMKALLNEKVLPSLPTHGRENANGSMTLYDKTKISIPDSENEQLFIESDKLYDFLVKRIKGQDDALKELSDMASIHMAQQNPDMPATVFMAGPTGTGKTETACALVDALNESCDKHFALLRINCNQYKEAHRVSQLLGSPNGYIGYGDSPIIAPLAQNPHSVVLWDEIEKAHPDILDTIMGAMDTGVIQLPSPIDGKYEIDCRRTVFLFTSNLPIYSETQGLGFAASRESSQSVDELCKNAMVKNGIKPEIAARIQAYLIYKPLKPETLVDIIALAIQSCGRTFGLNVIHIEAEIIQKLLEGQRSDFGARAYKQVIMKKLGSAFVAASKKYGQTSVKVAGTPEHPEIKKTN